MPRGASMKDKDGLSSPAGYRIIHGYGRDGLSMMRRRWDSFVRNLLGAEPPGAYEIGKKTSAAPEPVVGYGFATGALRNVAQAKTASASDPAPLII